MFEKEILSSILFIHFNVIVNDLKEDRINLGIVISGLLYSNQEEQIWRIRFCV